MFAFALWDDKTAALFCARDRFGIKPFYYARRRRPLYFASEAKALLPFLPAIETDARGARRVPHLPIRASASRPCSRASSTCRPGHALVAENGEIEVRRYWDVHYEIDFDHTASYFERRLQSSS